MATELYQMTVETYLRTVSAVGAILEKGKKHFEANGVNPDEVVEMRLAPDMLPFPFQLISVAHHSLGAMKALESGKFSPPGGMSDVTYAGLQTLIADTVKGLQAYDAAKVNALAGGEVVFKIGDRSMLFTTEDFVMSFSLPNVYFHAATTYDMLRIKGVPLGKRDFMGQIKLKS